MHHGRQLLFIMIRQMAGLYVHATSTEFYGVLLR